MTLKKYNLKKIISLGIVLFLIQFLSALEYIVPDIPRGLTTGDIDLDGDVDVLVGSRNNSAQDTITVFVNDGSNYFNIQYLEKETCQYLYCKKINNDNIPDLVTRILEDYQIVYYENEGNASFGDAISIHSTLSDHLEYIRICDMNLDGFEDIVFIKEGGYNEGYWGIMENNGFGVFEETLHYNSDANITGFEVGRINEDEYPDVIITTSQYGTLIFYYSFNGFIQEDFYPNCYHSPYIFDMNNDGFNDIGIFEHHEFPASECKLRVFYNEGNNTFALPDTLLFPGGTLIKNIADYNNDGFPDITYFRYLYAGPAYYIYVCMNNTDGTFADPIEYYVGHPTSFFSVISDDIDNNNYQDLIMTGFLSDDNLYRMKILFNDGTGNFVEEPQVSVNENCILNIEDCELSNYPNPFNPETNISFSIPLDQKVKLTIYNLKGKKVKKLINGQIVSGNHSVVWNGKDDNGKQVGSGLYFYNLKTDDKEISKKMLLLK